MGRKSLIFLLSSLIILFAFSANGQQNFSKLDSLRGSIGPDREWWDLTYYHLDINVIPEYKFIEGSVTVGYKVLNESQSLQIDLQNPLFISKIEQDGKELSFTRFGPVYTIRLKKKQVPGSIEMITIHYEGYPVEAKNAPWNGGISWKKDRNGNPFVASSCQGIGASIWWPCKDHMYDEVDSMLISVEVPENLIDVSNGRLRGIDENPERKTKTFHWFVSNPINNYGVNINIGDYVHWKEVYEGEIGQLDMDFWVLKYNEEIAKEHFIQASKTMEAFEYWFGPYPFYEDGYKLVEVPYLGMEHQSSVTYGNQFKNGYAGRNRSRSKWGGEFDYIIIHESAHEWFANNITYKDAADMWIHESFACYSESIYLDYWFGKEAGEEYNLALREQISNQKTMIGKYGVNNEGSDMYNKGAALLGMIRRIINDDQKWRAILRGLNEDFYHQTIDTEDIENYISERSGYDLSPVFDQYLRDIRVPILEYFFLDGFLYYRWTGVIRGFTMPVDIALGTNKQRLIASVGWQRIETDEDQLLIDPNYYVADMKIQ